MGGGPELEVHENKGFINIADTNLIDPFKSFAEESFNMFQFKGTDTWRVEGTKFVAHVKKE